MALLGYLVEYAPDHSRWQMETNHPLYALGWLGAAELLAEVLESLDPDRLGNQVRSGLAGQLSKLDIAPLAGRMPLAAE